MKTLRTLIASGAILGAALVVATVTTPNNSHPTFASYAAPEAGNTLASFERPQGNGNIVTASFDQPQGNGNIVTASYDQPQGNGNVVTAAVDAGPTGRFVVAAADPTRYGVTQNSPVA